MSILRLFFSNCVWGCFRRWGLVPRWALRSASTSSTWAAGTAPLSATPPPSLGRSPLSVSLTNLNPTSHLYQLSLLLLTCYPLCSWPIVKHFKSKHPNIVVTTAISLLQTNVNICAFLKYITFGPTWNKNYSFGTSLTISTRMILNVYLVSYLYFLLLKNYNNKF